MARGDDAHYRRGVGICLLNKNKELFVGARYNFDKTIWQMPQGGIDPGEEPIDAAIRELEEESSITSINPIQLTNKWFYYEIPKAFLTRKFFLDHGYIGQKQRWLLADFTGDECEINLDTPHPEFKAWRWMKPDELLCHTDSFKYQLYKNIFDYFKLL